jgi:hypothetical protein
VDFVCAGLQRDIFDGPGHQAIQRVKRIGDDFELVSRKNSICEQKARILTVKTGEVFGQARSGKDEEAVGSLQRNGMAGANGALCLQRARCC